MTRRWTKDPSFFCELLRRQECKPCRSNCSLYCLDVFHEAADDVLSILTYSRENMNNCPFCCTWIALEYRRFHLCEKFPELGRNQLLSCNVPKSAFNERQRMPRQKKLRSPSELDEYKHDSDREDEAKVTEAPPKTLIAPDTFWPFEQVFVGRRIGHSAIDQLRPVRSVCGEIQCTKMFCIPESHWKSRQCRTPAGDTIMMGGYLAAFPNRCPFCFNEFRWASSRLEHECVAAPWPYSRASLYQKGIAPLFAQQKIERRGRIADAARERAAGRITSHLKWCAASCDCENCAKHNSAGDAAFIIVQSDLGELVVTRPPMVHEQPPPVLPSCVASKKKGKKKKKKRRASRELPITGKMLKWQYDDSCTSGGCGISGTNDRGPKRNPWVMRKQPVVSRKFVGTDVVPMSDTGFVELAGFE